MVRALLWRGGLIEQIFYFGPALYIHQHPFLIQHPCIKDGYKLSCGILSSLRLLQMSVSSVTIVALYTALFFKGLSVNIY